MVIVANPRGGVCRICTSRTSRGSKRCRACFRAERRLGRVFLALVLESRIHELEAVS